MEKVTMGSCYLDKGESYDYVLEQLQRMAKMRVTQYYFDVICRPDQVREAARVVDYFYSTLADLLPWIELNKVFVGITCDTELRPAAITLAATTHAAGMLDINPERKR